MIDYSFAHYIIAKMMYLRWSQITLGHDPHYVSVIFFNSFCRQIISRSHSDFSRDKKLQKLCSSFPNPMFTIGVMVFFLIFLFYFFSSNASNEWWNDWINTLARWFTKNPGVYSAIIDRFVQRPNHFWNANQPTRASRPTLAIDLRAHGTSQKELCQGLIYIPTDPVVFNSSLCALYTIVFFSRKYLHGMTLIPQ